MASAKDAFAARVAAMNSARDNKRAPGAPGSPAAAPAASPAGSPKPLANSTNPAGGPRNTSIRRGSPALSSSVGAAPKVVVTPKPPATAAAPPTGDLGADEWKKLYENEVKSRQLLEHDREIKENEIRLLNERLSSSGSGNDGNIVRELSLSKAEMRNIQMKLDSETRKREALEAEIAKLKANATPGAGSRDSQCPFFFSQNLHFYFFIFLRTQFFTNLIFSENNYFYFCNFYHFIIFLIFILSLFFIIFFFLISIFSFCYFFSLFYLEPILN